MKRIMAILLLVSSTTFGQQSGDQAIKTSGNLYNEIVHMDSILFTAYNTQNLDAFKKIFTEDLEFYHDKGGLMDYRKSIEATKALFARDTTLRRELIKGSLEVYPIKDYGAVQIGIHRFCHLENGRQDCGNFKFVHIWKKTGNEWKLARVISYDH